MSGAVRHVAITFPYGLGVAGGGPHDCVQTARHLGEAGVEVTLLPVLAVPETGLRIGRAPVGDAELERRRTRELEAAGVRVAPVAPHRLHPLLDGLRVRRAVSALLADRRPDAVVSFWTEAAWLPDLLAGSGCHFAMVATSPYALWFGERPPGLAALLREGRRGRSVPRFAASAARRALLANPLALALRGRREDFTVARPLRRAEVVLARSHGTGREVSELFGVPPARVRVVYAGVDPAFASVPRGPADAVRRIVFVGALHRDKGIYDALCALGAVHASGRRGWVLRVAGEGEREQVARVAAENGIADRVELLGALAPEALRAELARAQLALIPSHAESFGLAVAECQAAALPVVAYAAGAVPEIVEDGSTGWLAPTGCVDALARAVEDALERPGEAAERGLRGRERTRARFTWRRTAEETIAALEALPR